MRKVIVISDGSDELGKEIARVLVKKHSIVMLSPHAQKLKKAAAEVGCHYIACDITSYKNCLNTINQIISIQGKIDCLINSASIWIEGKLEDCNPADIEHAIQVNMFGTLYLTKAVIPSMKKNRQGKIINIISQDGLYAKKEQSVYTASQWATTGFTKSLQPELSPFGISVTGVYPGKIKNELFEKMGIDKNMKDAVEPQEIAKAISFIVDLSQKTTIPEIGIKHIGS